ncbi:MAG TPA: glycosyltransferase family 39 protein [Thermoanaerobaculia bacterium]|nr:glycosyltransferase family 39 protein [Thermoanaerobaculia bacterium]
MSKSERILLWSIAAATLVLRALAFFRYRFDADEQHHAHVAWGWTAGMVQYRDYFDNHAPLFHLLMAPFVAMLGERADVLLWLRLPMLVVFAAIVWGTYAIAKTLYDERVAMWSAVLLALFPPFFLKSLEFRTDNLWTALAIAAFLAFLRERPFLAGLLLGCAFATSLKTMLLVITIIVASAIVRRRPARVWPAVAGFVIVPAILAIAFAVLHAWDSLIYCTLTFNGNVALTRRNLWVGRAIFPFTFAAVVWTAWRFRAIGTIERRFLATMIGVYTVTLAGFWVLISPRDFLPMMPLAAIFAAAALTRARNPVRAFAIVAALCVASLWYYADRFASNTAWHTTMMQQALRLTRPGEMIMDLKGETIFRKRPFYYAFENITRAQIAHGLLRDTVAEDVVRTRTYVAQADGPMWPPRARAFLSENFVNLGRLRAAGQWIHDDGSFTIAIPGRYIVMSERGVARGVLDGTAHAGARELGAGAHRFERATRGESVCVVWAPAVERGHSPFHLRDREF